MFSSRLVGDTGQRTLVLFHVCLVSCHAKIFSRCPDFLFPHTVHESFSGSLIVRISVDSHSHLLLSFLDRILKGFFIKIATGKPLKGSMPTQSCFSLYTVSHYVSLVGQYLELPLPPFTFLCLDVSVRSPYPPWLCASSAVRLWGDSPWLSTHSCTTARSRVSGFCSHVQKQQQGISCLEIRSRGWPGMLAEKSVALKVMYSPRSEMFDFNWKWVVPEAKEFSQSKGEFCHVALTAWHFT